MIRRFLQWLRPDTRAVTIGSLWVEKNPRWQGEAGYLLKVERLSRDGRAAVSGIYDPTALFADGKRISISIASSFLSPRQIVRNYRPVTEAEAIELGFL